jgi:hypothetical protein
MQARLLLCLDLLFSVFSASAQDDSPYARFGYEGKVLRTPQERQQRMMLLIPNTDTASAIAKVGLDPANQRYYLFGKQNQVLKTDTLASTEVARFLSVDPLAPEYPWYTPYQFAGNTPIQAIDLDGLEPKIMITNQITGYTAQHVYGGNGIPKSPLVVPTYKVILIDAQQPKTIVATANTTRDAWYSRGRMETGFWLWKGTDYPLVNRAFEPADGNKNLYTGQALQYPTAGLDAYALRRFGSERIPATPFTNSMNTYLDGTPIDGARQDLSVARGVMFHIGGWYQHMDDNTQSLAGSYGCFGFTPTSQIYRTPEAAQEAINNGSYMQTTSNASYRKFMNQVLGVGRKYKGTENEKKVLISVQKRPTFEQSKTISE